MNTVLNFDFLNFYCEQIIPERKGTLDWACKGRLIPVWTVNRIYWVCLRCGNRIE